MCDTETTTFAINGSYSYFVAEVGIAESAGSDDGSNTIDFEVDDESDNELGAVAAQYDHPQTIKVPVKGLSSLTLQTTPEDNCVLDTLVVWGNAELVG